MARRWGHKETTDLLQGIGAYGIRWFQRHSNAPYDIPTTDPHRSRQAIYRKALREWGQGGLTRGSLTLNELMATTGYSRSQLLRAARALKQKWRRLRVRGSYIISEEQAGDCLNWLAHDYWSKALRLYCCIGCQGERRPHYAIGLCRRCYDQHRRLCRRFGIPHTIAGQRAWAVDLDKGLGDGTVVQKALCQLDSGRALPVQVLRCLCIHKK